jgi:2'-5' RNA ligase
MGRFAPKQTILPQLQTALNDQDLQNEIFCTANKVILFESKLTPNGPIYSEIEVFTLQ